MTANDMKMKLKMWNLVVHLGLQGSNKHWYFTPEEKAAYGELDVLVNGDDALCPGGPIAIAGYHPMADK